ncbi:MAG: asparagine synthetase B family protein [Nostocaceae cyanobacterium]|nr:asparagine synthetase B family protein [Nostocaceae cyanobacterium]
MLFNPFQTPKSKIDSLNLKSSWQVAWGLVDSLAENVAFRDKNFAIVSADKRKIAISPKEEFVVIGDLWLSNKVELLGKLGIEPSGFTGTESQIIAELWQRWGCECLKLLVGMFALVVCDRNTQKLWCIRDSVGARTLYYTTKGTVRWISPQMKSLSPYRSHDLDLVALRDYLCCAFVPGEQTLWEDIKEVRPGYILQFPEEKVTSYWQVKENIQAADKHLEWHGEKLRFLLDKIIQEYLPNQQPVGVFLSGGLDSSSITALAAKFHHQPVYTYSIHFGNDCPNELEFSSLVAKYCHTQHHILEITFKDMWESLPETMAYLDNPIGDPLTVPNFLLGKLARKDVEVVLNGEGGDPCFGGPKNQPMLMNSLYSSVSNQDKLSAYLMSFKKCANHLPQLLKPEIWRGIETASHVFDNDLNSDMNYLNRLMAINIKFKGADHILTKVNNLTQAAGLHGLSPLFDKRVVELSMQIPPQYKLSGVEEKAVLKQAVRDILPDIIINRPKSGMMVPVQLGFRKYWQRKARNLLLNPQAEISSYLNQSLIRNWLDYRGDTWGRYGVKLWLLVSLEIWLQGKDSK